MEGTRCAQGSNRARDLNCYTDPVTREGSALRGSGQAARVTRGSLGSQSSQVLVGQGLAEASELASQSRATQGIYGPKWPVTRHCETIFVLLVSARLTGTVGCDVPANTTADASSIHGYSPIPPVSGSMLTGDSNSTKETSRAASPKASTGKVSPPEGHETRQVVDRVER